MINEPLANAGRRDRAEARLVRWPAAAGKPDPLARLQSHPDRVRIDGKPGGSQRDPIRHARPVIVQPLNPGLADNEGRQRPTAGRKA